MRMRFLMGILLILFGISMIVPIGIPIFRIVVAIIFLLLGIRILTGNSNNFTKPWKSVNINKEFGYNNAVFQKRKIKITEDQYDYNIVFGSGEIDLNELNIDAHRGLEINVVFGDGRIILDDKIPIKLEITSIFSGVQLSDGEVSVIGKRIIKTPAYDGSNKRVKVKVNVIFGSLNIEK